MAGSSELTVTSLDTSDKDSLCEPCLRRLTKTENKTASKFCTYCGEALCDDCSDHHQASKASADHIIIDNRSKKVKNWNELCSIFCNEHPNKKLELFCESHATLCCLSCMTKFHRHCEGILTIEEAAVGIKNSTWCTNILEILNKSRQQLEKSTSKGKKSIVLCYEKSKSALEKVDTTREKIRKHLDRLQENFKRNFSQFCTENIKVLEEKVKLFEKQTSHVSKSEEILKNAMSSSSDIEVLLEANRLKLVCSDIEKFIEDHNNHIPDISIEFHLNECIEHFANHFQQLGTYEIKTVDSSRQKPSFAECLLEHIQTIKLLDKSCITGVKFLSDGNIALIDNRYNTLYFYGIEAKKIVEIVLPEGPWDVELLDKNVLIVTFQERPYLQFVDILKRKLRKEIEIDEPKRSIAVFNNQIILSCKTKISVSDGSGKELYTFAADDPLYICLDSRGRLYFRDQPNRLTCTDLNGHVYFTYSHPELKAITGITCDSENNIYLAGFSSHNIYQISPEGKLLQIFSEGISKPRTIFLQKNGNLLLVSNNEGREVKICQLQLRAS